jgi:hypothetical protein
MEVSIHPSLAHIFTECLPNSRQERLIGDFGLALVEETSRQGTWIDCPVGRGLRKLECYLCS